jgi:hypothetical protein
MIEGARKNQIYFFNVRSITRVVDPFPGYSAQVTGGALKRGQWPPFETSPIRTRWFYTCDPPYRVAWKEPSEESPKPAITVPHRSPLEGQISILCSGQFPVIQQAANNPADAKKGSEFDASSLEDAKAKCVNLGFKPASEKFGDCVLKLSR